ncbi:MAG: addiction module protein, partial [Phycisphaerales bacterium]|nr:addiction module protein [Phycisphaerales bacterium]
MSRDDVLKQALSLSADDRAILAGRLLDSLQSGADPAIESEWAAEIDRRISAYDRGEIDSISAEELLARLRQRRKSAHASSPAGTGRRRTLDGNGLLRSAATRSGRSIRTSILERPRFHSISSARIAAGHQRARRRQLRRFPYGIVYSVRSDHILVVALMHLHRRPGYWS